MPGKKVDNPVSRPWTPAELTFLAVWAGVFPIARLAHALDRSPVEVIRSLSGDAGGPPVPAAAVARRLGCSPSAVKRARRVDVTTTTTPPPSGDCVVRSRARPTTTRRSRRGRPVVAVVEPDKPAAEYPSVAAAAEAAGTSRNGIYKALSCGCRVAGRLWTYRDGQQLPRAVPRVCDADDVVRLLAERHEAGQPLVRLDRVPPEAFRADSDDAERAFRRSREQEAELAERDPWRAVLAQVRSRR